MATVDTLQINIQTNSAEAAKGISSLSRAINTLSTKAEKIPAINQVFTSLNNAINKVSNNSIARIERLSAACGDLAYSVSQLKKVYNISQLVTDISKAAKKAGIPGLEKTPAAETNGVNAPDISDETKSVEELGDETEKTGKKAAKASLSFGKLLKSIGRIAFYRAIRSMLKAISQAFQEGMQNIDAWSREINDPAIINAHEVLSQYNTEWLKIKNTLGAVVTPALEALLPLFEKIADKIIVAGNELAKFMTIVARPDATDYVGINLDVFKEYSSELAKVNKQLQKFDELNNLTTKNSGGANDTDYNKYFDKYPLTEEERLKYTDLKTKLEKLGELMLALWAVKQVTEWGAAVKKLFAVGGDAAFLVKLGEWAVSGLALSILIDWAFKKPEDRTLWSWLINGSEEWGDSNRGAGKLNILGDKVLAGDPKGVQDMADDFWSKVWGAVVEVGKSIGNSAYKLLTPTGWWDTFIQQPIKALGELKGIISGTEKKAVEDFSSIKTQWSWLANTLNTTVPKAELNDDDLWNFQSAIKTAQETWLNLGNLNVLDPKVRTERIEAFRDAIKNVLETWKTLGQRDDLELSAVLKLTAALGFDMGDGGTPAWLDNYEQFIEKLAKLVEELKKDLTDALTSGNPLKGLQSFTSTLLTKLKTFLNDLSEVGSNVVNAVGKATTPGNNVQATPSSLRKTMYFTAYASGGYPTQGQLFLANEAGAEMVGSIGGRTAVANNQQITEAIATACYNAMSQALSENGMNVTLQGDANGLFRVVQKQARMYRQTTGTAAF